jgi:Asp-tRNA(Asn)/Glu-tRNA(Gln) amidotransferase A subunit family amidase
MTDKVDALAAEQRTKLSEAYALIDKTIAEITACRSAAHARLFAAGEDSMATLVAEADRILARRRAEVDRVRDRLDGVMDNMTIKASF